MRNEANSSLTLLETQRAALEILKRIVTICEEEGLIYYLAYGTLIGAVRHHAIIPWDDDIDIMMPRPDYNRLIGYFDKHSNELLPLVALHNSPNRKLPFLITRVSDTTYQQIGECGLDVPEIGAFVDVYPLDGLGNDRDKAEQEKEECFRLKELYLMAGNFRCRQTGNGLIKRSIKHAISIVLGSPQRFEKRIMKRTTEEYYSNSAFVSCKVWTVSSIKHMVHSKSDFGDGIFTEFEGLKVRIPCEYDAVLRRQYGDYMLLPSEEDRVPHHHYSIVVRSCE